MKTTFALLATLSLATVVHAQSVVPGQTVLLAGFDFNELEADGAVYINDEPVSSLRNTYSDTTGDIAAAINKINSNPTVTLNYTGFNADFGDQFSEATIYMTNGTTVINKTIGTDARGVGGAQFNAHFDSNFVSGSSRNHLVVVPFGGTNTISFSINKLGVDALALSFAGLYNPSSGSGVTINWSGTNGTDIVALGSTVLGTSFAVETVDLSLLETIDEATNGLVTLNAQIVNSGGAEAWFDNIQFVGTAGAVSSAIPEPSSAALLGGLVAVGLVVGRRRRCV